MMQKQRGVNLRIVSGAFPPTFVKETKIPHQDIPLSPYVFPANKRNPIILITNKLTFIQKHKKSFAENSRSFCGKPEIVFRMKL